MLPAMTLVAWKPWEQLSFYFRTADNSTNRFDRVGKTYVLADAGFDARRFRSSPRALITKIPRSAKPFRGRALSRRGTGRCYLRDPAPNPLFRASSVADSHRVSPLRRQPMRINWHLRIVGD